LIRPETYGIIVIILVLIVTIFPIGTTVFLIILIEIVLLIDGISRLIHGFGDKESRGWSRGFSIGVGMIMTGIPSFTDEGNLCNISRNPYGIEHNESQAIFIFRYSLVNVLFGAFTIVLVIPKIVELSRRVSREKKVSIKFRFVI
jgi:uncharacterized membrane protein HdeD (DUF308 family)